jgi:hypothetical protein
MGFNEINHPVQRISGRLIQVIELIWHDNSRSFEIYEIAPDGILDCLNDNVPFNSYPTNAQIINLFNS